MNFPISTAKYTLGEKQHLLANLDIEVAHRTRQFESWLADRLENFNIHQEGQVSRIPKQVRNMTMREFGDKYNGNIQAALRGFQKEKFVAAGGEGNLGEIDKDARKRKWMASQEAEAEIAGELEPTKAVKNRKVHMHCALTHFSEICEARTTASPKKKAGSSTGPGTAQRARLLAAGNKTPGAVRLTARPRPPFGSNTRASTLHTRPPSRPASPAKHPSSSRPGTLAQQRVPSSSTFNPALPPKTPKYPGGSLGEPTTMRLPRKDESMLSVNGSPLANPYEFGLGWFKGVEMAEQDTDIEDREEPDTGKSNGLAKPKTLKHSKSNIVIRRDPSVAFPPTLKGLHSRTNSQASILTGSSQHTSSFHSRESSQTLQFPLSQPEVQTQPNYPSQFSSSHSQPLLDKSHFDPYTTPKPTHTRSFSALVAIPTKDGHLLEFDPLQTSPGALDALEGITDSAKKQARAEMGRLVQAAVDKWKIG
ncbi:hypothetical protein BDZ94DRAFT_1279669 [Collybia nuda]|uniref:Borealin N-terminal domain-containing protein n=1 Tax=Collybia nuda TaxID=64659 RepID=A0A9P6CNS8_9AGAR|nr:hypothetical protein BDZ94DRAFT_1279669 [Collybia nuda]